MKSLSNYGDGNFLNEGDPLLLDKIRPEFLKLIAKLHQLGANPNQDQLLETFKETLEVINKYENDIETVEREAILETIYDIGEIVGLDRTTEFAEAWRGDW